MGEWGTAVIRRPETRIAGAALVLYVAGITAPRIWIDEKNTAWDAHLIPLDRFGDLMGTKDIVHGLYYLVMRVWLLGGDSHLSLLRLPSVLAMAGAAVLVYRIGLRLNPAVAPWSAAVFVALPVTSRYAQEARSYAMVMCLVCAATLLLLRALDGGRWWPYGVAVGLLGVLNIFAVLILAGHLALAWRRRVWWLTTVLALIPWSMVAAVARTQAAQIAWVGKDGNPRLAVEWTPSHLTGLPHALWLLPLTVAAAGAWRAPRWVAVWAFAPPILLLAADLVEQVYWPRYVLTVVPGLALCCGYALARLPRRWAIALAVVGVAVLAIGQAWVRMPAAHLYYN